MHRKGIVRRTKQRRLLLAKKHGIRTAVRFLTTGKRPK
jgi:hypothetical protein